MLTKTWTAALALPLVALAGLPMASCTTSGELDEVMTADRQAELTPDEVLTELKEGNERFLRGDGHTYDWLGQAEATSTGQFPKAIVLGCLDSRVPPEVVFDKGIGDIFVGRVAGNFENQDMLGSFEFGTKVAGAKLIVVLGHTGCGAVKGTIDQAELGNLTATLANIEPAVRESVRTGEQRSSANAPLVDRVIEANVRRTVADIQRDSDVIAGLVRDGDLKVVGAVYDIRTGRVRWLDS